MPRTTNFDQQRDEEKEGIQDEAADGQQAEKPKRKQRYSNPRERQQKDTKEEHASQQCRPNVEKRRRTEEDMGHIAQKIIGELKIANMNKTLQCGKTAKGTFRRPKPRRNSTKCTNRTNDGETPRGRRHTSKIAESNP